MASSCARISTELLPADHPAVHALRTVAPRQRSASNLVLLIESAEPARAVAFIEALRPRLDALRPSVLTQIDWGPDPEPARFAERWRWLYAGLPELAEVERLAHELVARRSSPLYVGLDEEDPAQRLAELEQGMKDKLPRAPAGARFMSEDERTLGLRLWRRRDGLGGAGDHEALAAVQRAVDETSPARYGDVRVRYTGPIAQAIEEQAAIRDDLSIATLACVALVLGALWLAFGRVGLIAAALWPTLLGLGFALAVARVALGSLNLNTAFLISIILGNGINAPIVLLAELARHRDRGLGLPRALARAILRSAHGIVGAMLAAAAAYAVLGATRFRGFRQFGLIGGLGMLAVLAATLCALPPLLLFLHQRTPRIVAPGRDRFSPQVTRLVAWLRAGRRAPLLAAALSTLAVLGVVRFAEHPIEWDLSRLRSREGDAARLWSRMEQLGMGSVGAGYIANTAVLLVDRAEDADRVAAALRANDAHGAGLLAEVRTLGSLLPRDQADKLRALSRLRALIDGELSHHGALLSEDERQRLASARPPDELREVRIDDLPRAVREAFTEIDGTRGRLIGIDADPRRYHDWDGHVLLQLSSSLSVTVGGTRYVAASASTVFAGMLETLIRDAPRLAALALVTVAVIILLLFRSDARPVLCALAIGLTWLLGAAGLLGLRLNFMSFAAIPISIGVGADYAANLWSRHRPSADRAGAQAIAASVVLCSLTTIIGYSSLLLGRNGALRSFGLLCDLGELSCLLAALLSTTLFRRRGARRERR